MVVLRSPLFVPGNRYRMLEKALSLAPDAYCPDMEDSVPESEKDNARRTVVSFLPQLATVGPLVIPRVNPMVSGLLEEDLAAVVGSYTYGVSLGKIDTAAQVDEIASILDRLELRVGVNLGHTRLILWLETAKAIVNAYEICSASSRVVAVAFGAEDFTNDMGVERTSLDSDISYPRSVVSIAARAAGVMAIDTPYFHFRDPEGLRRDSMVARTMGFCGKFAIHPDQIGVINESFVPTEAEIENAQKIIDAFENAEKLGSGSISLEDKVVDIPVVKRARNLLASAKLFYEKGD